jgi:preprotein translocase subunit SecY
MSADEKFTAILSGMGAGIATFIAVEIVAGFLSVIVRLIEQYTKWFYLGDEWNNWLGAVFLYWAILPAIFLGLVVCARKIKSRWNE